MFQLVVFALAGFAASLVDGALGMGFGPTCSSILLASGLAPAAASTSVNLAKVATGVAAAASHWQFRNVNPRLVLSLALPGCLGALAGVTILSSVDGQSLKPILALLLTLIGLRIFVRFARMGASKPAETLAQSGQVEVGGHGVKVAGFLGGVTNGMIGAWGPVVTPYLLHRGVAPRFAIGCVNTAEIAVASVSAFSLLASLGRGGVSFAVVAAMLVGGVIAAPVAAWLIRHIPPRPMGVAVAGMLLLSNARELVAWGGVTSAFWLWMVYATIVGAVALALIAPLRRTRLATPLETSS